MKKTLSFEIKAVTGNSIEGHGSVFGNVDLGGDVVLPGAFQRSLSNHKAEGTSPAMLWQHDHQRPIGVWTEFAEDDTGLYLKGEFADTADGRDARTLAEMRAVRGLSIGFQLRDADFDKEGIRLIKEVDLWETSLVTFPMNPKAQIEAFKSQFGNDPRSFENYLREAGCSRKSAKEIIHDVMGESSVMLEEPQCEADEDIAKMMSELNDKLIAERLAELNRRILSHG